MSVTLRKADNADIEQILQIEEACFTSRWTKEMFLYEFHENPFGFFYVLEDAGVILGFVDFWVTFETCQLANIAILPAYQGKGYSKFLMDHMIHLAEQQQCETIMLEVRVSNEKARALYTSYAFIEMNVRKGYYNDNGEDAIVMCKALGGNLQ